MLTGKREMDNMLPGDTTAEQNATEGIRLNIYFKVLMGNKDLVPLIER